MTPDQLSAIHKAAFAPERGWSAAEIVDLLDQKNVVAFERPGGFALVRTVADEAELLTLAVDPKRQRRGVADTLMRDWLSISQATYAFLEVAEDNRIALALYRKHGFAICGHRKRYYRRAGAPSVDAVLMQASLTFSQGPESSV